MNTLSIVWNKSAINQFEKAINYIANDSAANAESVKKDVLLLIDSLIKYPERFPPDKDKVNNDEGRFRAFEKYRFRISYYISKKEIIIVRIRHTSQNPQSY